MIFQYQTEGYFYKKLNTPTSVIQGKFSVLKMKLLGVIAVKKGQQLKRSNHMKLKRVGVGSQISSMNVVDMVGGMLL